MSGPDSGLQIEGVRAGYGDTIVLEGVSLALKPGGTLAVLGRNGVGKTTLLATIMGLTNLRAGSVRFAGTDISALPVYKRVRLGIGFVPQEREIFRSLTVEENLLVATLPGPSAQDRSEPAARSGRWSLARVYDFFPSLGSRRRNRGNQLSGGEQQMLAIGRALMGNPRLLLMDEPMEGLAPVIVDAVLKGIDRLKREDDLALVLVEQHARIALEFTDQAIVLDRGALVYSGPSRALLESPERMSQLMGVAGANRGTGQGTEKH
jgi:branched-chain amino acid transport system ATP-binding protein